MMSLDKTIVLKYYKDFIENPPKMWNAIIQNIIKNPTQFKILGTGGTGVVYDIPTDPDLVIKKSILCEKDQPETRSCYMLNYNNIVVSTNIGNDKFIMLPDFLMEITIAKEFRLIMSQKLILGVVETKMGTIDFNNPISMYIIMKKYKPIAQNELLLTEDSLAPLIIEVMVYIFLLQTYMSFVHGDLHWGNLLLNTDTKPRCVELPIENRPKLFFSGNLNPVISDFGSSIFSKKRNTKQGIVKMHHYVNMTAERLRSSSVVIFNQYYDSLTLLKSIELIARSQGLTEFRVDKDLPNITNCFFSDRSKYADFFYDGQKIYKPKLGVVEAIASSFVRTPIEIIKTLFEYIQTTNNRNIVEYDCKYPLNINDVSKMIPYPKFTRSNVPEFPYVYQKVYYISINENDDTKVNIRSIMEVDNDKIFAFTLFIADNYLKNIYRYFYDYAYQMKVNASSNKNDDDYFLTNYLAKQLRNCTDLILNSNINPRAPGYGIDQWHDFGVLIMCDATVLNSPMLIAHQGFYYPWLKNKKVPDFMVNHQNVVDSVKLHGVPKTMGIFGYGTIKEYIISYINEKLLNLVQIRRFGLYEYKLSKKYTKPLSLEVDGQNISVKDVDNTIGFIGSITRFLVLQDPKYDIVLFRDAHTTLPNRNYVYDRQWYNTWINDTRKKFWIYHGAFYNPSHFNHVKSGLAATWGVRKLYGERKIFDGEYKKIFSYDTIDTDDINGRFFDRSSYGIDERLMYRLYKNEHFTDLTYLVGITHMLYLWAGQENPRAFKSIDDFHDNPEKHFGKGINTRISKLLMPLGGLKNKIIVVNDKIQALEDLITSKGGIISDVVTPDTFLFVTNGDMTTNFSQQNLYLANEYHVDITTLEDFGSYFFSDKPWICRPAEFILPSFSFYTDIRCVFLYFINVASAETKNTPDTLTYKNYFDTLEKHLSIYIPEDGYQKDPYSAFALNLQRMIPPRWNLVDFLFGNEYLDPELIKPRIKMVAASQGVNVFGMCNINQKLWIGNEFNFDKYFIGDYEFLPENIPLPENYPIPQNI